MPIVGNRRATAPHEVGTRYPDGFLTPAGQVLQPKVAVVLGKLLEERRQIAVHHSVSPGTGSAISIPRYSGGIVRSHSRIASATSSAVIGPGSGGKV